MSVIRNSVFAAVLVAAGASSAWAAPAVVDYEKEVEGTGPVLVAITDLGGGTITVTLPDGTKKTGTVPPTGRVRIPLPPGTKGNVDVEIKKGAEIDTGSTTISSLNPPSVETLTSAVIQPGSTATLGAFSTALTGSFATIDTSVDYNPASPTYGQISGILPTSSFNIQGGSCAAGNFGFTLSGDQSYTVNLASIWTSGVYDGSQVALSTPISGTASCGSQVVPFSGTVTGTDTFEPGGIDDIDFTLQASTADGPLTVDITAIGTESLIPEPTAAGLFGIAALGLGAAGLWTRSRRRPG